MTLTLTIDLPALCAAVLAVLDLLRVPAAVVVGVLLWRRGRPG